METSSTLIPAGEALAEVERVLDRIDPDRSRLDAATRLALVRQTRRVCSRVEALKAVVTAEADQARASEQAARTPLVSWLGMGETISRKEAAGAVKQARQLGQHRLVGQAAITGKVGTGQARAIAGVLTSLAPQLEPAQQVLAEQVLVDLAGHLDADQLSKAAGQVLAQVAPATANEQLEQHLQRQTEQAYRQRSLRFFRDGAQVRFDGSLPRVEAEAWIAQLDACQEQRRRTAVEARDPLAVARTPEQRHADALIALIHRNTSQGFGGPARNRPVAEPAPTVRVLVQLDYDQLTSGATGAGQLLDGTPLSAGELRRVCCDAEIIPVVLGSASEVLDVGRCSRLVTPGLRAALLARDGGCVFPGCDAPPQLCEAHHIVPWWAGGVTAIHNLVLLCHRHHPVIEPARHTVRDQWQVRIADDGLPEFVPPARLDRHRQPVRHTRHQRPADHTGTGPPSEPGTGPPPAA